MAHTSFESDDSSRVAVVFLTRLCGEGFPLEADMPACLLPLGWQSLAEHALDQLHLAGIEEVHLVTSDASALLRRVLGAGDRWGLKLHWHVTESATHPYRILRHLDLQQTGDVLVGHAERFVAAPLLQSLLRNRGVLCVETGQSACVWSGWSCLPTEVVRGLGSHAPWSTLRDSMLALQGFFPAHWPQGLGDGDWLLVDAPHDYLQAQRRWMQAGWLERAPLSWIRQPWGLQHPGAKVETSDDWVGPAVVGPGCVVQAGARLTGPVTLSRDVWLGSSGEVSNSVILERSFIAAGLTLENCVVNGTRLWRDGITVQIPDSDAILTRLSSGMPMVRWLERATGQLLACVLLLAAAPFLLLAWAWLRASGQPSQRLQALQGVASGWMRVALGHWAWWGVRARSRAQLALLPAAWRLDLERARVGIWHMAADDGAMLEALAEQEAAADLFWMLQLRESFLRLCVYRLGLLRRSCTTSLRAFAMRRRTLQTGASASPTLDKYSN